MGNRPIAVRPSAEGIMTSVRDGARPGPRQSAMSHPITQEQMERYVRTAQARAAARRKRLEERRARAWAVAQQAAVILKTEFGAERVLAFGSLLQPRLFHERSDVDLAVWGLDERRYLRALARLLDLEPDIEVDLVEAEQARPALLRVITREGKEP